MIIDINLYGKVKHAAEIAICDIEKIMRDENFAVYKVKWDFEHKRGKPYSRIFITNRPEEVRERIFYMGEDRQSRMLASRFVSFLGASAKCEKMVFFFDTDANGKLVDFPEPIDFPDTPYPIHPHVDCMDAGICEICGKETNVWTIIGEPRERRTVCLSCIAKDLLNAIRTYYQIKIISIEKMGAPYLKPYQWEKRLKKLLELLDKEGGQTFEEIKSKIGLGYGAVNWLSGHKKFGKYWYMGAATQIEANQLKGKRTLVFSITERGRRRLAFMKRVYGC